MGKMYAVKNTSALYEIQNRFVTRLLRNHFPLLFMYAYIRACKSVLFFVTV